MPGPGRVQIGAAASMPELAPGKAGSVKRAWKTRQKKKQMEVRECFEFAFFRAGC